MCYKYFLKTVIIIYFKSNYDLNVLTTVQIIFLKKKRVNLGRDFRLHGHYLQSISKVARF